MEHDEFCPCTQKCDRHWEHGFGEHRIANYALQNGMTAWCSDCHLLCICRELRKRDAASRADEREKVVARVSDAAIAVQRRMLNGEPVAAWEFASAVMSAAQGLPAAVRGDGA